MPKQRKRRMVKFWLDVSTPEGEWLYQVVQALIEERQLSWTLRKGLALMATLRAGELDQLDELFPFVREGMKQKASDQIDQLIHEVKLLQSGQNSNANSGKTDV